jgi:hypothetical protein
MLYIKQATQRTIHLTTLQDATFQTGSKLLLRRPRSARDGMTPLPRLKLRGTDSSYSGIQGNEVAQIPWLGRK